MNIKHAPARPWLLSCCATLIALSAVPCQAGVTLNNTRVVFDGSKKETTITVSNPTAQNYAIQAWINTEADDDSVLSPFMATPPLFRLDSRKEQGVRILDTGAHLPTDRESLFYFNVQEIPAAGEPQDNVLKVALRTRIKMLYRPSGLEGSALTAGQQLRWSLVTHNGRRMLQATNPSPYHVSFIGIKIVQGQREHEIYAPVMVAPRAERLYPIDPVQWQPDSVVFSTINDHGGYSELLKASLRDDA